MLRTSFQGPDRQYHLLGRGNAPGGVLGEQLHYQIGQFGRKVGLYRNGGSRLVQRDRHQHDEQARAQKPDQIFRWCVHQNLK